MVCFGLRASHAEQTRLPPGFEGCCGLCGVWGHKARDCRRGQTVAPLEEAAEAKVQQESTQVGADSSASTGTSPRHYMMPLLLCEVAEAPAAFRTAFTRC
eukprot:1619926-Amphidinium_carterae.2